jgi:hypothetical protein
MHVTLSSRILALLAFLTLASLGIRAANDGSGSLESGYAASTPETEHFGCHPGHPASLCGLDAYPAGDLFIVEPSFG